MFRRALCVGLVGLTFSSVPIAADSDRSVPASRKTASSGTKRVVWTLVGIGAGFGAGLFVGLHAFDDAVNSDRKVWTSALVGAAAGGLAAGLLSTVGHAPQAKPLGLARNVAGPPPPWTSVAVPRSADHESLRRRVRALNDRRDPSAGRQ